MQIYSLFSLCNNFIYDKYIEKNIFRYNKYIIKLYNSLYIKLHKN